MRTTTLALMVAIASTGCREQSTGTSAAPAAGSEPAAKPAAAASTPPAPLPATTTPALPPPTPANDGPQASAPPSKGGPVTLSETEIAERNARRAGVLGLNESGESAKGKATIDLPEALPTGFDRAAVERLLPGLQYCYDKTLVAVPTLEGDVSLSLTVGRDGRVAAAKLSGLDDPDLSPCVKDAVKGYKLRDSKRADQATVSFTLQLRKVAPAPQ